MTLMIPGIAGGNINLQNAVNGANNIPMPSPLLQAPSKMGLLNQRLQGLATNPLFNFGMGMLGSQSPHLSDALAAGGRGLQGSVMLDEKLKDGSHNRQYRNKYLELMKNRQGQKQNPLKAADGYYYNADGTRTFPDVQAASTVPDAFKEAQNNARLLFPNDPQGQNDFIRQSLLGQDPSLVREYGAYVDSLPEGEQPVNMLDYRRAGSYQDTGAGRVYLPPSNPTQGTTISGGSAEEIAQREASEKASIVSAEAEAARVAKLTADAPKAYSDMMSGLDKLDLTLGKINDLKGRDIGAVTGGEAWFPTVLPKSRGTEALIEEIKSGATIEALIDAKAKGATFGALSDTEINILASEIAALNDLAIDDEDYVNQIDKIERHMKMIKNNIMRAYKEQYGEYGKQAPSQTTPQTTIIKYDKQGNRING